MTKPIRIINIFSDEYNMLYEEWINSAHPELSTNNGENLDRGEEFEQDYCESVVDEVIKFEE